MARSRNIKPGLFKNEVLGVADPFYTLLFEGLWLLCDREGRLEDRPLRIKAEIFPYREGMDINAMLNWLVENAFIQRYKVDAVAYIQVLNFGKHQNPHKNEPESELPGPEAADSGSEGVGTSSEFIGSTRADSLLLIPDSGFLIPETSSAEESPRKRGSPAPKVKAQAPACPEDVDEQTWNDWLALRARKKADVSQTTVKAARKEADKAGLTLGAFLTVWCLRGSQGLQADWLTPNERAARGSAAQPPPGTVPSKDAEATSRMLEREAEHAANAVKGPEVQLRLAEMKAKLTRAA